MGWDMGDGMGWWMSWWMLFGGLLWIAFWGVTIYLIVTLVREPGQADRAEPEDDALAILKRRYARGDIGRDDYERMRRDLAA